MYCKACGKEIAKEAKFCSFCGTKLETEKPKIEKMICPKCNKEFDVEMMFCDECGARLIPDTQYNSGQEPSHNTYSSFSEPQKNKDGKLMEMMVSIYNGNRAIGVAIFSGTVYLYSDRIETKAMLAGAPEVFVRMDEISDVSKGSYMVIWSSIILRLKNGNVFTIAGAAPGSANIDRAIQVINNGINKKN